MAGNGECVNCSHNGKQHDNGTGRCEHIDCDCLHFVSVRDFVRSEIGSSDVVLVLIEANGRMAETITAQADEIVSLSQLLRETTAKNLTA